MDNLPYIIWRKEYDTGIVLIDRQHQNLVELINRLKEAHNQKQEKEVLRETILKLVEYTKFHFGYEEKHMSMFAYTGLEEHKKMHKVFIDEIIDILNVLKKGDYENLSDEILEFVRNWLMKHILKNDREYAHFYKMKKRYE